MSRVVLMAAASFAFALLPPACAKLMGQAPPPADTEVAPPPPPITSATTPPAWRPPEPPSSASAPPPPRDPPPPSADLLKARAAADTKDFKKVRALLEKKVRGGRCAPEEAQLVFRACTALKDKPCAAEVKAKHADDLIGE